MKFTIGILFATQGCGGGSIGVNVAATEDKSPAIETTILTSTILNVGSMDATKSLVTIKEPERYSSVGFIAVQSSKTCDNSLTYQSQSPTASREYLTSDGDWKVCVQLTSVDGSVAIVESATFRIDFTPPAIAYNASSSQTSQTPVIRGTASESSTVTLYTDSGCSSAVSDATSSDAFASSGITTTQLPAGQTSSIYAKASDAAGNPGNCTLLTTVTPVDTTEPTLAFNSVSGGNPGSTLRPIIIGTASESSNVTLYFDSLCAAAKSDATATTVFASPGITVNADVASNTTTTIYAKAIDDAGNASSCTSLLTYTHDDTAPTAPTVTGTTPSNDTTPEWNWTTGGTGSNLGNGTFRYKLDNATLTSGATVTTSLSYTPGTALSAGNHTLYVQERDEAGNWSASGSKLITIDTTEPTLAFTSVSSGNPGSNLRPVVIGTASESSDVTLYFDSLCAAAKSAATANTVFASPGITVNADVASNTTTTIYAKAIDDAGNASSCTSLLTYTHDDTPPTAPTVTGTTPTSTTTPIWSWTAGAGSNVGNGTFRYKLDDSDLTSGATETSALTYAPVLSAGNHTLYVQERDAAGNWSASGSKLITIDTTEPTLTFNSVSGGNPGSTLRPIIIGTASESSDVTLYFDSLCATAKSATAVNTVFASPGITVNADVASNTTTTIYAKAIDAAGNASSCTSLLTYTHDNTPPPAPTVAGTTPSNDTTPEWNWTTGGSGSNLGNGTFRYKLDDSDLTSDATETSSLTYAPATVLSARNYTLYVQERDAAGNWSASGSKLITIDTTAPTLSFNSVSDGNPGSNLRPVVIGTASESSDVTLYFDSLCATAKSAAPKNTVFASPGITVNADVASNTTTTIYAKAIDDAGNASCTSLVTYTHDDTPPPAPTVTGTTPSNDTTPTWSWTAGTGSNVGNGTFRYKLDDSDLTSGATETSSLTYTPGSDLAAGNRTLYVQERDAAGNWSASGSRQILIDVATPSAPTSLVTAADSASGSDVRYDDDNIIFLKWTAPAAPSSGIASYTVTWYNSADCTAATWWDRDTVTGVTGTSYSFNLSSGASSSFNVTAISGSGVTGTQSACSGSITFDPSTPAAPTGLVTAADSADGSDVRTDDDTSGVWFAWTAPASPLSGIASYTLTRYTNGTCSSAGTDVTGITATSYNLTSTVDGTSYSFKVRAISGAGTAGTLSSCSGAIAISVPAVTIATATNGLRDGTTRHSFYDTVNNRHWILFKNGTNISMQRSSDGLTWDDAGNLAANVTRFSIHYKVISGVGYVFVVSEENSFDVAIRRGQVGATSISFGTSVNVFDGTSATDLYQSATVTTDDTNAWVAASRYNGTNWQVVARESTNAADGNLTTWGSATNVGTTSGVPVALSLMPRGGGNVFLIRQEGSSVRGFEYTGSWAEATTGGTSTWVNLGGQTNVLNSYVMAIAVDGSNVYVGGNFTDAGGVPSADYIARWDGTRWNSIGAGLNNIVNAIAVANGIVYVGGDFTDAGGDPNGDRVAMWDGSSWRSLGTGVNSTVNALAHDGTDLYAGGGFSSTNGDTSIKYVARWNGTTWSKLGSTTFTGSVSALATTSTRIYIGGSFLDAGSNTNADRIVAWNKSGSSWEAMGSGASGQVSAINAVSDSEVYAGGLFANLGGVSNTTNIGRWDGTAWQAMGTGTSNTVRVIVGSGSAVYVGGDFTTVNGSTSVSKVALWNGTLSSWSAVGSNGPGSTVFALGVSGSSLYIGGVFTDVAGRYPADYLIRWDGSTFQAWGVWLGTWDDQTYGPSVSAMAAGSGSTIYVGGTFTDFAGIPECDYICLWNGSAWSGLGSGLNGTVSAITVSGSNVYVGGSFADAGGLVAADRLAKWSGSAWSAVGALAGPNPAIDNGSVTAIAVSGTDVYVGGSFVNAAGNGAADRIANYNGTSWSAMGSGVSSGTIYSIVISGTDIYIGGSFLNAGGDGDADYIARCTSSGCGSLTSGYALLKNGYVYSMTMSGTRLYIGGSFGNVWSDSTRNNIAYWDTSNSSFNSLAGPDGSYQFDNSVVKVFVNTIGGIDNVYIAGYFTYGGGVSVPYASYFNGTNWSSITSAVLPSRATEVLVSGSNVYLGGAAFGVLQKATTIATNVVAHSATTNDLLEPVLLTNEVNSSRVSSIAARTRSSGTWSAATTLASSLSASPVLSFAGGAFNDLFAFWHRNGVFEYKRFDGASWDASATTLINASSGTRISSCDEAAGGGLIKCVSTSGSAPSFLINVNSIAP